jgi:hypothetical protein
MVIQDYSITLSKFMINLNVLLHLLKQSPQSGKREITSANLIFHGRKHIRHSVIHKGSMTQQAEPLGFISSRINFVIMFH